ncbi:hypothetical protein HU200_021748 [Digitaria exilis]|uniref:Fe2OG dioxygenase domain-containing protein n=1 Tax=Digitaria exilis TaxID=1010633 RepID=A0A835KDM6_9POAL|nr:hypothetical protein HU200_021748 [Digitaria exilis]
MASRLRLVCRTPGAVGDSAPDPGVSVKAEARELEGEANRAEPQPPRMEVTYLGGGSKVVYVPRFVAREKAWEWFDCLDKNIPWTRPEIRVFGRSSVQVRTVSTLDCPFLPFSCVRCYRRCTVWQNGQMLILQETLLGRLFWVVTKMLIQIYFPRSFFLQPRDVCYIADEGLTDLKYSGHQPHAHSWDEFPVLKDILKAVRSVHDALPGSYFNSLLLNRYKTGSDYVSWHADDEPLYGPTPEIASVTFGCEREFLLRKKPTKSYGTIVLDSSHHLPAASGSKEAARKRLKVTAPQQHSFVLKHGSLLVMRGYTQRDWQHSVPKRAKASSPRINLTFRHVLT